MIYHKGISGIVFIGEKHKHIDIFITCAIQHSSVLYKENVQDRDIFYDNFKALNLWLCRCRPCNCFPHLFLYKSIMFGWAVMPADNVVLAAR